MSIIFKLLNYLKTKRGPSNHKAFLTKEGKKIIEDRKKDFELIFLMKESNSYVFTSEANHYQMLSRETITKDVNRAMRSVSNQFTDKPNITSHSFRINMISNLLKTTTVQHAAQIIGHSDIKSTRSYERYALSKEEIQELLDSFEN